MIGDSGDVDQNEGTHAPRDPDRAAVSTLEADFDYNSSAYHDMIDRSLLNLGNNVRLKRAIEKAKRGEPVVIAFIGGSITHGAGAAPIHLQSYAYHSYEHFKTMFAPLNSSTVQLIKAGVGGTPSELGVIRYERDVLRDGSVQPDIVIVEFAVNDADDETRGNCYESLVLKALASNNEPAVILLFSVFRNDWNLQDRLAPVGFYYDLPMVSMKDALVEQFQKPKDEGGVITKEQYFHDIYHPTNVGHRIMADALANLFRVTDRTNLDQKEDELTKYPIIGNDYVNVKLLDRKNADQIARVEIGSFCHTDTELQMTEMDDHDYGTPLFPNNWMNVPGEAAVGSSFKLHLRCSHLILIYKDSDSERFGTAQIKVDGQPAKQADPHQINWTHCHAMLLFSKQKVDEHVIEIDMAPGHEDKHFTILGFGYVD
ncbi:SGNH/GDSL hydrolase family protein [Paenibacillus sp. FSL R7-0652]|uniref:SGNH/GDSL hydrolase family protein n=1 Tax=Paenibacillus sp. FSL R7-0652 TaxID=2921687 RepID=UPI00315B0133